MAGKGSAHCSCKGPEPQKPFLRENSSRPLHLCKFIHQPNKPAFQFSSQVIAHEILLEGFCPLGFLFSRQHTVSPVDTIQASYKRPITRSLHSARYITYPALDRPLDDRTAEGNVRGLVGFQLCKHTQRYSQGPRYRSTDPTAHSTTFAEGQTAGLHSCLNVR